jgi:O-antigen ligase
MKTLVSRRYLQGQIGKIQWRGIRKLKFTPVLLIILAGLVQAGVILVLGIKSFPLIFFLILILPWLVQDAYRIFIWLMITWPILILYIRVPLPAGIPDLGYDRVLVVFLLSLVLVEALLSKRKLTRMSVLDVLSVLYLLAQIGSRIFVMWFGGMGNPDLNGLLDIILIPLAMYWLVKNLLTSPKNLKWFLYALVIASLLICLTGLIEQVVGMRIFKASLSIGGSEVEYQWQDANGLRASGALGNPAIYGATLGIGILAGLCCLVEEKGSAIRVTLLAIIAILLYGVYASYTRSAWISVLAVLFLVQFFIGSLWKKTLFPLLLGLVFLAYMWNRLSLNTFILQRATDLSTINIRLSLMELAWQRFLQKPLLGWGDGALNIFSMTNFGVISHNVYLSFLVDGGIVLFISFLLVVAYLFYKIIRTYKLLDKGSFERNVLVAMAGSILIYLVSGLSLELQFFGYFNALFWVCIGVTEWLGIRYSRVGVAHG